MMHRLRVKEKEKRPQDMLVEPQGKKPQISQMTQIVFGYNAAC